jgi:hypothetical protein
MPDRCILEHNTPWARKEATERGNQLTKHSKPTTSLTVGHGYRHHVATALRTTWSQRCTRVCDANACRERPRRVCVCPQGRASSVGARLLVVSVHAAEREEQGHDMVGRSTSKHASGEENGFIVYSVHNVVVPCDTPPSPRPF